MAAAFIPNKPPASWLNLSLGTRIKNSAWYDGSEAINRFWLYNGAPSQLLYLVTLLSLSTPPPPQSAFSLSRTPSPVIRHNSAHNFFSFSPSSSLFLSFLIHSSVSVSCLASRRPAAVLRFLWSADFSGTHSELHSTDSSHIPLKGPLQDQISPGVRPPPYVQELLRILH